MIIAIPFVPQRGNFVQLATSLVKFGGLRNHILLLTSQPEYAGNAQEFFDSVKDHFSSATLTVLGDIPTGGYYAANEHFSTAVKWAASYVAQPGEISEPPILYFDPAFVPTKGGWVDDIQSDYYKFKSLILGTTDTLPDTQVKVGSVNHTIEGGKFFTGPVVLDNKFARRSNLLKYLQPDSIWRKTLQWEMLSSHTEVSFDGLLALGTSVAPTPVASVPEPTPEPVAEEVVANQPSLEELLDARDAEAVKEKEVAASGIRRPTARKN